MPVPTTLRGISGTAANNSPAGSDTVGTSLDDYLRAYQAVFRQYLAGQSSTVAPSAGVADLTTATGHWVPVSGSSTITGLGSEDAGIEYVLTFTGSPILVHSTALQLPGQATLQGTVNDMCVAESLGSGSWRVWGYSRLSGQPPVQVLGSSLNVSQITNSLAADVLLNNTANYFDGPSVAQGSSGTWFVSGTVTISSTTADGFIVKLWDGTTTIASAEATNAVAAGICAISVSGYISSPAGNLRISVKDPSTANGKMLFNQSGNSKDSTITAIRIG